MEANAIWNQKYIKSNNTVVTQLFLDVVHFGRKPYMTWIVVAADVNRSAIQSYIPITMK
jgi:hypothetical protein